MELKKVAVIGCGAFGYALSLAFCRAHPKMKISAFDVIPEVICCLNEKRVHPYFHKEQETKPNFYPTCSRKECLDDAQMVILAVPAQHLRKMIQEIREYLPEKAVILNVSKALEMKTHKRMSEVIKEELRGARGDQQIFTLSGGMLAREVAAGKAVRGDIGGERINHKERKPAKKMLEMLLKGTGIKVNFTEDIVGVELGGSFKNVIAIGAGIADGLGEKISVKKRLVNKLTEELGRLALTMGAKKETLTGYSWKGDIKVTCFGDSRNRLFGELIGKGMSRGEAVRELAKEKKHAEGLATLEMVRKLAQENKIKMHLVEILSKVIEGKEKAERLVR
jgi:glycerol-3-phosphate dehydrogenase (NAD(P)+)